MAGRSGYNPTGPNRTQPDPGKPNETQRNPAITQENPVKPSNNPVITQENPGKPRNNPIPTLIPQKGPQKISTWPSILIGGPPPNGLATIKPAL